MQTRGQRAPHPHLVPRSDLDDTARFAPIVSDQIADDTHSARHRRPTMRMDALELERVAAESAPPRTRMARGSSRIDVTPLPDLLAPEIDLTPILPFRARRPWLATAMTVALATGLILALHHIISAS